MTDEYDPQDPGTWTLEQLREEYIRHWDVLRAAMPAIPTSCPAWASLGILRAILDEQHRRLTEPKADEAGRSGMTETEGKLGLARTYLTLIAEMVDYGGSEHNEGYGVFSSGWFEGLCNAIRDRQAPEAPRAPNPGDPGATLFYLRAQEIEAAHRLEALWADQRAAEAAKPLAVEHLDAVKQNREAYEQHLKDEVKRRRGRKFDASTHDSRWTGGA